MGLIDFFKGNSSKPNIEQFKTRQTDEFVDSILLELKSVSAQAVKQAIESREARYMKSVLEESYFLLDSLVISPKDREVAKKFEEFLTTHETVDTEFRKKFFQQTSLNFYMKLGIAVIPALVLGKLFDDKIEAVLEKPIPIAIALIVGGVILLFIDRLFNNQTIDDEKQISTKTGLIIGFWQCLAMMPGTSRAAASIIGGMQQRLTMRMAAEFSFFLAVPTMLAVTLYSVFLKDWNYQGIEQKGFEMILKGDNLLLFILGNIIAFIVAVIAIKFFIGILKKYGFRMWGWYRIVLGVVFLIYFSAVK